MGYESKHITSSYYLINFTFYFLVIKKKAQQNEGLKFNLIIVFVQV